MPAFITPHSRLRRLFFEGFTALDIAEPLASFDLGHPAAEALRFMEERDFDLVALRRDGLICGYVRREALVSGSCGDHLVPFDPDSDLIAESASLLEAVRSLAINLQCFVTVLDQPAAIITLADLEKPPMRMFLFGVITLGEMIMTDILRTPPYRDSWPSLLSAGRLAKARELQAERERRGQKVELVDCLQYGDKGWILSYDRTFREALGFTSRRELRESIKELELLRNNLAHTQQIVPSSWQRIVVACSRMEENLEQFQVFQERHRDQGAPTVSFNRLETLLRQRPEGWWQELTAALPELREFEDTPQPPEYHAEGDVAVHTRLALAACPADAEPALLWAVLLHDIGKPATTVRHDDGRVTAHDHAKVGAALAESLLNRLGAPAPLREQVVWLVRQHTFFHSWNLEEGKPLSRRQAAFLGDARVPLLLELVRLDGLGSRGNPQRQKSYEQLKALRQSILSQPTP